MTNRTPVPADLAPSAPAGNSITGQPGASTKQAEFILGLLDKKALPEDAAIALRARAEAQVKANAEHGDRTTIADGISLRRASEFIGRLKEAPAKTVEQQWELDSTEWPDVPEGRYALAEASNHVTIKFYKVDRPTEGRWAGYTFLSAGAGGPHGDPDWHPIKAPAVKRAILERIEQDPAGAAKLYGTELGHCGVCGRTLTDETSRAYGIGPVCRANTGW